MQNMYYNQKSYVIIRKSYLKVYWPSVERDGKLVPDPDWFLTRFLNKVREGKWTPYEDGHTDGKGKKGRWVCFNKGTSVLERVEGNSKPNEQFLKSFYPSSKKFQ